MHNDGQHQRGLRILVVDDNHDAASSMSMLLELEGHRTGTVHNGLEAVREATRVRYDAVLLDLGMPVMDGFQAAAVLGQLLPAPALIACSARDDAETRSRTAGIFHAPAQAHLLPDAAGRAAGTAPGYGCPWWTLMGSGSADLFRPFPKRTRLAD